MKNGLFHKKLGFPAGSTAPFCGVYRIALSDHAKRALNSDDGIVNITDGETLEVEARDIIEIEVCNGIAVKAVVRLAYSDTQDVAFVILPPIAGVAFCKTFWLNDIRDAHKTLALHRYVKP